MLYFGPEVMMPLASALAAAAGAILIFWQRVVGWVRRLFQGLRRLLTRRRD